MTDVHDDEHDDLVAAPDDDTDLTNPEDVPLIHEEEPHAETVVAEEFVEELEKITVEEPVSNKHKVYPVAPEELTAPLKPEELWDEDGTI